MTPAVVAHAARARPAIAAGLLVAGLAGATDARAASVSVTAPTTTAATPPATTGAPTSAKPAGGTYRGMRGARVRTLQRTLVQLGLPISVDGSYGPATERAVRRYEREEGVAEDGAVSRSQMRQMRKRATPRRSVRRYASRTLRTGARGTDVRAVQRVLVDLGVPTPRHGIFTAGTAAKVKTWEAAAGVPADGVVEPAQARSMRAASPEVRLSDGAAPPSTAAPAPPTDGSFVFPIRGPWKWGGASTGFGDRGGKHQGIDVLSRCGTPLVAAEGGKVVQNRSQSAAGNYVIVRGAKTGVDHAYMHLKSPSPLKAGDTVATGAPVGVVGDTGNAEACLVHFEVWSAPGWYEGGKPRDPEPDLRAAAAREGLKPEAG